MVVVELRNVSKSFGKVRAVDNASLRVEHGEFFSVLGPSGCGKTTLLRLISGLEFPDSGRIYFDGRDVTDLPSFKRETGMVFQNYALWPHMTVFENIAYGLKIRKYDKNRIKEKVKEVLKLVKLEGMEERYPTQLSGGQQQRVALARALVIEPKILLLDEPLSNLDAKLRVEMREEIKRIQKHLGLTAIYVTHDQEEAMVISDRIAVMNSGRIIQVGSPVELYRRPSDLFVATFLGRCNMIRGRVSRLQGERAVVSLNGNEIVGIISSGSVKVGDEVVCIVRPESFSTLEAENKFEGMLKWSSFAGSYVQISLETAFGRILAYMNPSFSNRVGDIVRIYARPEDIIIISAGEAAYEKEL
ncbi:MAG: ABC transporter ATP-binding protein, partial [Thermoproteota archaeon]|jgi:spermidine/putrescine ABC transporter ATP-binding subunit|uniref:Molybdate/tungstate import ATP-binding protein WtpC n=1 Tax=Candidatus Methanodesulfokora washburnensis TaxID=2478471 RepID=A0A3R9PIW3_9CREN